MATEKILLIVLTACYIIVLYLMIKERAQQEDHYEKLLKRIREQHRFEVAQYNVVIDRLEGTIYELQSLPDNKSKPKDVKEGLGDISSGA